MFRWAVIVLVNVVLFEGMLLFLFPDRVQAVLTQADPRLLQLAGMLESIIGAALLALILLGGE